MITKNTYKQRTYLDPIHGPIQLNLNDSTENLLVQIIDTKEFQRLRRIRQMGLGAFTFHGAEHTRFGHSLGAFFIAKKIINHLSSNYPEIKKMKTEILISALLHDVGHGPFSHTSEKLAKYTHEDWTKRLIVKDSEVNLVLKNHDKNLPKRIIKILEHKTKPIYVSQIISSYIDCDRLDYLHRDSYYVGVPYGLTGSDRIIESLEIDKKTKKLVVNESIGLDAVIHYLHARYSMYQQIYQHKKNLACDFMLRKIIELIKETKPKNIPNSLFLWLNYSFKKTNNQTYIKIDDYLLISCIQNLAFDPNCDKLLSQLCNNFINRKLYKSLEFRSGLQEAKIKEVEKKVQQIAKAKGLNPNYHTGIERSSSKPYESYKTNQASRAIFVKQQNGEIKELSNVSGLVKALSKENVVKTCLVFTPELEGNICNIKGFKELFK